MRILFIAPLPPPVSGQSLASEVLLKEIVKNNDVTIINYMKIKSNKLLDKIMRFIEVSLILIKIYFNKKNKDMIYLSLSESILGNYKDIFTYFICYSYLSKMIIHMLGGAGMKRIIFKRGLQYRLNKYFISRLGGVIVEGRTQANTFAELINRDKIHIVENFAEEYLFINETDIRQKYFNIYLLRILFLSNFLLGKGYNELVDAYVSLDEKIKEKVQINFVGGFRSGHQKMDFLRKIADYKNLVYYKEFVGGNQKKALYYYSHIFCLPSYYPYEGQPISILEAYATGCVVITTNHSGIVDIFTDKINGFLVDKRSSQSIRTVIENIIKSKEKLVDIGLFNQNMAYNRFRISIYCSSIINIFKNLAMDNKRDMKEI